MKKCLIVFLAVFAVACQSPDGPDRNMVRVDSIAEVYQGADLTLICPGDDEQEITSFREVGFFNVLAQEQTCALRCVDKKGNNCLSGIVNNGFELSTMNVGSCDLYPGDVSVYEEQTVFSISFDEDGKVTNYLCGNRHYVDLQFTLIYPRVIDNRLICTNANGDKYSYQTVIAEDGKLRNVIYSNTEPSTYVCNLDMRGDFGGGVTQVELVSPEGDFYPMTGLQVDSKIFRDFHAVPAQLFTPHAGVVMTINELGVVELSDRPAPNSEVVDCINDIKVDVVPKNSMNELWLECSFAPGRVEMDMVTTNYFTYTYDMCVPADTTYACNAYATQTSNEKLFTNTSGYDFQMFVNGLPQLEFMLDNISVIIDEFGNIVVDWVESTFMLDLYDDLSAESQPNVYYGMPYFWGFNEMHQIAPDQYLSDVITLPKGYYEANVCYWGGAECALIRSNTDPFREKFGELYVNDNTLPLDGYKTYEFKVNWVFELMENGDTVDVLDADLINVIISDHLPIPYIR